MHSVSSSGKIIFMFFARSKRPCLYFFFHPVLCLSFRFLSFCGPLKYIHLSEHWREITGWATFYFPEALVHIIHELQTTSLYCTLPLKDLFCNQKAIYIKKEGYLIQSTTISLIYQHTLRVLDRGQKPRIWNLCSRGVFPSVCLLQGWTLASGICFLQEFARASLRGSGGHRGEEACFGKPLGSA